MSVRPARPGDERGLAEVRVRAWQAAYRGIIAASELDAMSVERDAARFETLLPEHTGLRRLLVVQSGRDGPSIAGFCSFGAYRTVVDNAPDNPGLAEPETVGEIYACYLHPEFWGSGLADELMAESLRALADDGWPVIRLWVLEKNERGRRFYTRHGWTTDGDRRTLPMSGDPIEVRMQRALKTAHRPVWTD